MTTSSKNDSNTQASGSYKLQTRPYGNIVLTLKNVLLPEDKLSVTPSEVDGLDKDTEIDLRIYGCELIQTAGILLKLPQVAMASGQVLLQRFYYSKSFVRQPVEQTAMACVCLASKIEEAPRRVRDIISVFMHIRQVNCNKPIVPVILDQQYIHLKNQVIKAERRVLKELGFSVHIKHPHKIIVMYLQVLNYEKDQRLMQFSWNYMNDSLRTDVFVRYQPETVACACIYLTARKLRIPLPKSPAWYTLFGVTEEQIRDVCFRILRLYNRPKVNVEALEKKVDELVKKYQEAKLKARGGSGNNTPSNNSPSSPSGVGKSSGAHNAWGGFISRSGFHAPSTATSNAATKHSPQSPANASNHNSPNSSNNNNNQVSNGQTNATSKHTNNNQSHSTAITISSSASGHTRSGNKGDSRNNADNNRREDRVVNRKRSRTRSPAPLLTTVGGKGRYKKSTVQDRDRERIRDCRKRSYSKSRSPTPVKNVTLVSGNSKKTNRDKRRSSLSPSNDRENNRSNSTNKHDKYDRHETKYDLKYDSKNDSKYHSNNSSSKYRINPSSNSRSDRDRSKERSSKDSRRR